MCFHDFRVKNYLILPDSVCKTKQIRGKKSSVFCLFLASSQTAPAP